VCPRRKEAVAKLRALGDARAVPALKKALVRKGKGKWRKKNVNDCLIADAKAALVYLTGLAAQTNAQSNPPKMP
jgi:hypothetical protein